QRREAGSREVVVIGAPFLRRRRRRSLRMSGCGENEDEQRGGEAEQRDGKHASCRGGYANGESSNAHARVLEAAYCRSRFSGFSGFSGAPVPVEPMNSFVPSAKVTSRAFARNEPSLAWKPSMVIWTPYGSEFLVQPRRVSAF